MNSIERFEKKEVRFPMFRNVKRLLCAAAALTLALAPMQTSLAGIYYPPDVTAEMCDASYWADLHDGSREVILTAEEIAAFNEDIVQTEGTMVTDLTSTADTFDGIARNAAIRSSATADAEYYFGWTYGGDGEKADWSHYEKMIDNGIDPTATSSMAVRYGIAVNRTVVQVFPSDEPIWDDPSDPDFDYQAVSAVRVNEPMLIYTTSADGKYYLARISSCSGWIAAEDVAICQDKEEWLSAWDLPADRILVVYGNKVYTDASNSAPQTARRMLTAGTVLELASELAPDTLVNNRSPYHNYVVWLPVRRSDGTYEKQMALIPQTAEVNEGYLPLTQKNIAAVALNHLGDAYGWGGMMDVEDCSGLVRTVYACFGLTIARNGNWQWNMNVEKLDMTDMSLEEKCLILDDLPLGAALCFPGHEMIYLGKVNDKYYVLSSVSSIMSPATGNRLRTRDVMINTLDVLRANGRTWLENLNKAFMPCYPVTGEKSFAFPDLKWYHDGVAFCLKNGLMTNREDGTFGLTDPVTATDLAAILQRLNGDTAVDFVLDSGDVPLTRQQVVTILYRYAQARGDDVTVDRDTSLLSYGDALTVAEEALPAMRWACGSGILCGKRAAAGSGLILDPEGIVTRAQLATMLLQFRE